MTRTAAAVAALCLAATAEAGPPLKPYQQAAAEKLLAKVEPSAREMARPQIEAMLAPMSEAQVEMMLAQLAREKQKPDVEPAPPPRAREATPEDLAYNRRQYEPKVREFWAGHAGFDRFVSERIAAQKPAKPWAVWGPAWRYEVYPLSARTTGAGPSAELYLEAVELQVPKDGRYRFDVSGVKTGFDRAAVEREIAAAGAEVAAIGGRFVPEVRKLTDAGDHKAAHAAQARANAEVAKVQERLDRALDRLVPAAQTQLVPALQRAVREN